jgi:hypothetical protein
MGGGGEGMGKRDILINSNYGVHRYIRRLYMASILVHVQFCIALLYKNCCLKGPQLEIFGSRVYTQIRPAWVGDLGTRPTKSKFV